MTVHDYTKVTVSTILLGRLFSHITIKDAGYKTPCWMWFPDKPHQYAFMYVDKVQYLVHRLMYCLFVEPISAESHTDHLCRVPCCVNPSHLEAVTPRENCLRGNSPSANNARKTHCVRGHEFTDDNIWWIGKENQYRKCRQCGLDYNRKYQTKDYSEIPKRIYNHTHCARGHERVEPNIRVRADGYVECKICQRMKKYERRTRRLQAGLPRD